MPSLNFTNAHSHLIAEILLSIKTKTISHSVTFSHFGPSAIITSRIPPSTNIKSFVNRKMGLSTDTKPISFLLKDILFHEHDTGNLFLSDVSTTTLTQGPGKPETFQNKQLNSENTDFGQISYSQSPFSTSYKKIGRIIPSTTINDSFHGIIGDTAGLTLFNANKVISTATEGLELEFHSVVDGQKMGYVTNTPVVRRSANYEMKGEFKCTASKQFVGFSNNTTFDDTLVLRNTDMGFVMGFNTTDTNFYLYHNDASGANVKEDLGIVKDSNLHTYEIKMSPSNIIVTIDGSHTLTVTTKLPGIDDDLYFLSYGVY